MELKKLGIEFDMPPNKLKTGNGDGVCSVILRLCQVSLQNKFKFKKPVIKDDSNALDDEGDDMENDMDGNADIADFAANQHQSDDDIEDFANDLAGDNKQEVEQI